MRMTTTAALLLLAALVLAPAAQAQATRTDYIWARSTNGQHITLDGKLDEPAWSKAETKVIQYGVDNGYPGSGYKTEGGTLPNDQTNATLKFLVDGNYLYLGAVVNDKSIGGSFEFNREDGFLMMVMDHLSASRPTPPLEHYYSWWYPEDTLGAATPGRGPSFRGAWASEPEGTPRTSTEIDNWNAVTLVHGLSNSDAVNDTSYVVEMQFNLASDGYHPTDPAGDVVEWSLSIYDVDWYWPIQAPFSANRTWWQNPWGNTSWYDEVKIYTRPDVTIDSATLPAVGPDLRIPNAAGYVAPLIDGRLTDAVWAHVPSFDIRYDDTALRNTYPNTGKWRSGQYQPSVNGGLAPVFDPGDCTVKYFFLADTLYLGFDVRDQAVQYYPIEDRWDGFAVTLNEKSATSNTDHYNLARRLAFQVGPTGSAVKQYYLPFLVDTLGGARVQTALNPGTTVDTISATADHGYQAELAVDLTKLGFPHGLGDGTLMMGITMYDGDSFLPYTDSYATRTWWFRQYEGENGPAWCYLDPSLTLAGVGGPSGPAVTKFALLGNSPNPFGKATVVRYSLPEASEVTLEVYDLSGRRLRTQHLGAQGIGEQRALLRRENLQPGLYVYRLKFVRPGSGVQRALLSGKMMLID
ncbi:MAG: T9SS type A sorting domain-containing protein [Candidatus Eiseniibacteriota bacterium]